MEKTNYLEDVSKLKIIPLDESKFDYCIDNVHFNSIGAMCEMRLDPILTDKLEELIDEEGISEEIINKVIVHIESDFTFSAKNDEVKFMMLSFDIANCDLNDLSLRLLTKIVKDVFGTDNISLKTDEKNIIAYWLIEDKKQMLWLIDKLNELGIDTESTFKVVSL